MQLRTELHRPRIAVCGYLTERRTTVSTGYGLCRTRRLIRRTPHDRAQTSRIRPIENIERLGAKLKTEPLAEAKVLGHRQIDALG